MSKWRRRFAERRLDGLHDEPRPGKPRTIGDDDVERVIVKTLEETPADATHWSSYSMARATGMSQSTVSRIWRAFGLKPHLVEEFKVSSDPQFIDKVGDIVGLYLNPPEAAVVLCLDEKTQVQALDRTSPVLPLMPGAAQRAKPRLPPPRHHQPLRHPRRRLGAGDPVILLQYLDGAHRDPPLYEAASTLGMCCLVLHSPSNGHELLERP